MAKYCKHCGAKLDEDASFCSTCGKSVSRPIITIGKPEVRFISKGKLIWVLILFAIIVVLALFSNN